MASECHPAECTIPSESAPDYTFLLEQPLFEVAADMLARNGCFHYKDGLYNRILTALKRRSEDKPVEGQPQPSPEPTP